MQPRAIHQFHYNAAMGDAITQQMFFIQSALKEIGIGGEIFCKQVSRLPEGKVRRFEREVAWDSDLILIHHSLGNPALEEVLKLEIPKAIVYHNITPPSFYAHDPHLAALCREGRQQLNRLKDECVVAFAVSRYNAAELLGIGFENVHTLPLFDLGKSSPRPKHSAPTKSGLPKHILFVGRIAVHKNQRAVIETFFYLKKLLGRGSKLFLVGGGDPIYYDYLRLLIKQLGLKASVQLTGKVTARELSNYYEAADAFLCMSLHEGFCIPLVEAMRADVPVFYRPLGAVPETMRDSGVCLESEDPALVAETIFQCLEDKAILDQIVASQQNRLISLRKEQSKERLQETLSKVVDALRAEPGSKARGVLLT